MLYSLSIEDQERVLAVGQARLLAWCLERSIPTCLLHFPRLVTDGEYVVETLWWLLSRFCERGQALKVFDRLSEPEDWLSSASSSIRADAIADMHVEIEALRIALRDVKRERDVFATQCESYLQSSTAATNDLVEARAAHAILVDEIAGLRCRVRDLQDEGLVVQNDLGAAQTDLARGREQLITVQCDLERTDAAFARARSDLMAATSALSQAEIAMSALEERSTALMNELRAIRRSGSYRLGRMATFPFRLLREATALTWIRHRTPSRGRPESVRGRRSQTESGEAGDRPPRGGSRR